LHVLVTGASSGIGEAIAREYAKAGAAVTVVARRKERLDALCGELGARSLAIAADLSRAADPAPWLRMAEGAHGLVDVLVNNAGMQIVGPTAETSPDAGEELLRLNVASPMRLTIAVLPGMLERRQGTIVDVASMAALTPTPGMYYYNASKAALGAASESLRAELRGTGVHVVTVYPGPVHTAMGDKGIEAYQPSRASRTLPWGTTEELARRIRHAVEKRKPRVIYPASYAISRRFPNVARWFVGRYTPPLKKP